MEAFIPRQTEAGESRTALIPSDAGILRDLGLSLKVEESLGTKSGYLDDDYRKAGAEIVRDRAAALARADIVLRVSKPPCEEIDLLKKGALHMSFLDPFTESELVARAEKKAVSLVSMELMPRTSIAQKMDALSSQANLAGYYAVIRAAASMNKAIPMMMTPAGTLSPARFFIVGVGVAGLQAIATAKRLGARVEAYDTRPIVEEQVHSLGARFVRIDLGETEETKEGYARQLTHDQIQLQRREMARVCARSDVVITTAKVFGRRAPLIITRAMVREMKPGSIIVDLAVDSGGNVEESKLNEEVVTENDVRILGFGNLENSVPYHASQVFSSNLRSFLERFWDPESKSLRLNLEDDILKGCLLTHHGEIVNKTLKTHLKEQAG